MSTRALDFKLWLSGACIIAIVGAMVAAGVSGIIGGVVIAAMLAFK